MIETVYLVVDPTSSVHQKCDFVGPFASYTTAFRFRKAQHLIGNLDFKDASYSQEVYPNDRVISPIDYDILVNGSDYGIS